MATFTDIYKNQLKTKGILSSLGAAAVGRAKERMDPRNILFGGKGMFAATGQKIFGEGYKAIPSKKIEKESGGLNGEILNLLKQNNDRLSVIGKNTMPLRAIARDMNVMRQNTVKLVKLAGGEAATKADMFFRKQGEEETAYENALKKGDRKPQPVEKEKGDKKSFLEGLFAPLVSIATAIAAKMSKVLTPVLDLFTMIKAVFSSPLKILLSLGGKVLDVAGATGKALMRLMFRALLPFLTNPVVLGLLGAAGIAWMLNYLRGEYDEGKDRYLELAKKKKEGTITKDEEDEMRRIQTPNYRKAAVDQLGGYDPVTGTYQGGKTQAGLQRAEEQRQVNYRDLATEQLIAEGNRNPTLKDIHDRAEKLKREASGAQTATPVEPDLDRPAPGPKPLPEAPAKMGQFNRMRGAATSGGVASPLPTSPMAMTAADFQKTDKDTTSVPMPMTAADFQKTDKDRTPVAVPSIASPTSSTQPENYIKFTERSGSKANFEKLNSKFKGAVLAAAMDYNSKTGRKLQINSAVRNQEDQQRLWDESVAAGRPGKTATGMPLAKPGTWSSHENGVAIDVQNFNDPEAVAALNRAGLYAYIPNDPVHFQFAREVHAEYRNRPSLAAASPSTGAQVAQGSTQITDARMSTEGSSTTVTNVKNQRASGQQRQTQQAVASPHNSDMNGLLTSARLAIG